MRERAGSLHTPWGARAAKSRCGYKGGNGVHARSRAAAPVPLRACSRTPGKPGKSTHTGVPQPLTRIARRRVGLLHHLDDSSWGMGGRGGGNGEAGREGRFSLHKDDRMGAPTPTAAIFTRQTRPHVSVRCSAGSRNHASASRRRKWADDAGRAKVARNAHTLTHPAGTTWRRCQSWRWHTAEPWGRPPAPAAPAPAWG